MTDQEGSSKGRGARVEQEENLQENEAPQKPRKARSKKREGSHAGALSPASAPQGQLNLCHHPQVSGPSSHIQASPLPYRVPRRTRTPWAMLWGPWRVGVSRKDSR